MLLIDSPDTSLYVVPSYSVRSAITATTEHPVYCCCFVVVVVVVVVLNHKVFDFELSGRVYWLPRIGGDNESGIVG